MSENEVLEVTPAGQWRRKPEGVLLTLPSGKVASVRRTMEILDMVRGGRIPNSLLAIVQKSLEDGGAKTFVASEITTDQLEDMMAFIDEVAVRMMLDPVVVPNPEKLPDETDVSYEIRLAQSDPGPDRIFLADLDPEDKQFLFYYAQGGAPDVETFRAEQSATLEDIRDGKSLARPAKRATRATKRA